MFFGNFFPDDYLVDNTIKWKDIDPVPQQLLGADPYKEMGFTLADFNMVVFYQYERNQEAVFNLVSDLCSDGTFVVCLGEMCTETIPENLQLLVNTEFVHLYRVT